MTKQMKINMWLQKENGLSPVFCIYRVYKKYSSYMEHNKSKRIYDFIG